MEEQLKDAVDTLWEKYDADGNGTLDRVETRKFVLECIEDQGVDMSARDKSDIEFDEIFRSYDTDGNGTVSKDEMAAFIMRVMNGEE